MERSVMSSRFYTVRISFFGHCSKAYAGCAGGSYVAMSKSPVKGLQDIVARIHQEHGAIVVPSSLSLEIESPYGKVLVSRKTLRANEDAFYPLTNCAGELLPAEYVPEFSPQSVRLQQAIRLSRQLRGLEDAPWRHVNELLEDDDYSDYEEK